MLEEKQDFDMWKGCLDLILLKCKFFLDNHEEDRVNSILFSLMDNLDPNFTPSTTRLYKKNELDSIISFAIYISENTNISMHTREMGLNLLETLVTNRRKHFKKKSTLEPIIKTTYKFACNSKTEDCESEP